MAMIADERDSLTSRVKELTVTTETLRNQIAVLEGANASLAANLEQERYVCHFLSCVFCVRVRREDGEESTVCSDFERDVYHCAGAGRRVRC